MVTVKLQIHLRVSQGKKKKAGLSPKMWAWLALGLAAAEDER